MKISNLTERGSERERERQFSFLTFKNKSFSQICHSQVSSTFTETLFGFFETFVKERKKKKEGVRERKREIYRERVRMKERD